jgi:hypothetical protein
MRLVPLVIVGACATRPANVPLANRPHEEPSCTPITYDRDAGAVVSIRVTADSVVWQDDYGGIKRAPIEGGPVTTLVERGADQSFAREISIDGGHVAFVRDDGLFRVPLVGGPVEQVASRLYDAESVEATSEGFVVTAGPTVWLVRRDGRARTLDITAGIEIPGEEWTARGGFVYGRVEDQQAELRMRVVRIDPTRGTSETVVEIPCDDGHHINAVAVGDEMLVIGVGSGVVWKYDLRERKLETLIAARRSSGAISIGETGDVFLAIDATIQRVRDRALEEVVRAPSNVWGLAARDGALYYSAWTMRAYEPVEDIVARECPVVTRRADREFGG